jgi:hypothetical protein
MIREMPEITREEMSQAIKASNPGKAAGEDGLSFLVWQKLLPTVTEWIMWLYQASLDLAYVLATWKMARIVVLRKSNKPDYTKPKAYRPISLLSTLSKGLEAIVANWLSHLAERFHLLPEDHVGGRKKRSAAQALNVVTEAILGS